MIKLHKGPEPAILMEHSASWTAELRSALESGQPFPDVANRYGHVQVRKAIRAEAFGKCVYCEGRFEHTSYPHVEHILPKSRRPDLCFAWDNLAYACQVCNTRKGDYFDPDLALVNPFVDDPNDHLQAHGHLIFAKSLSHRGEVTVRRLFWNRLELDLKRLNRLKEITPLVDRWRRMDDGPERESVAALLRGEASDECEYAIVVRAYLGLIGFPLIQ